MEVKHTAGKWNMLKKAFFLLQLILLLPIALTAREVETFYGVFDVEEPVLLELIDSPAMQRLKKIHQYGVSYYYTHYQEEYTRYDHSIGVFAILRARGASLDEQIAGLLHDVSHTVFSHVGDWVFKVIYQEKDYQNGIHADFLKARGIERILNKYGYTVASIMPTHELFPSLESSLPSLCADRIDYNIQGAYHRGFITYDEAIEAFHDFKYEGSTWVASNVELMKKISLYSYYMSENCWGSALNYIQSRWLADAILRALELGDITQDTIHFGTDDEVWSLLDNHEDPLIQDRLNLLSETKDAFTYVPFQEADHIIKTKFRGIDPLIATKDGIVCLSKIMPEIGQQFIASKALHETGWGIKFRSSEVYDNFASNL